MHAEDTPILFQECFTHSEYLLNTYCVPGTTVGPGCEAVNKTDKVFALLKLVSSRPNKLQNAIRTSVITSYSAQQILNDPE